MRLLQRERSEEEDRDHERGRHEDEGEPAQDRASAQETRIDERCGRRRDPPRERGVSDETDDDGDERVRAEPAVVPGRDEAVDDGAGGDGRDDGPEQVEPSAGSGHRSNGAQEREQQHGAHRHVDEEHPGPARSGGEHAAEQDADGGTGSAERRPHPESAAQLGAGERPHDHRERGRRHHRGSDTLQSAGDQEELGAAGEARQQRGDGEQPEAGEHEPSWAEDVGGLAAEQHEPAEHERVDARHPGESGTAEPEVGAHVRQRDRHDGDVDDEHELGDAEHREDAPPPRIGCRLLDGRCLVRGRHHEPTPF